MKMEPVPTQPIPVLIGGHADANLRRAARLGDGWMGAGGVSTTDPDDRPDERSAAGVPAGARALRHLCHAPESFTLEGIKRLEDLGVTHTAGGFGRFNPYGLETDPETLQEKVDNLGHFGDEVIAKLG